MNEIFENNKFSIGNYVKIITGKGDEKQNYTDHLVPFIGQKGVITEINEDWEHPYLIMFEDEALNKQEYLWRKEDIIAI